MEAVTNSSDEAELGGVEMLENRGKILSMVSQMNWGENAAERRLSLHSLPLCQGGREIHLQK